jgi:hypothetical protein
MGEDCPGWRLFVLSGIGGVLGFWWACREALRRVLRCQVAISDVWKRNLRQTQMFKIGLNQ